MTSSDELAAPSGCLQYLKAAQGYLESFNYRDKSDVGITRYASYLVRSHFFLKGYITKLVSLKVWFSIDTS